MTHRRHDSATTARPRCADLLWAALCAATTASPIFAQSIDPLTEVTASDGTSWDEFGKSASVTDELAVIGSPFQSELGYEAGAAYTYRAADGWAQEQRLLAPDGEAGDQFGWSVALDGQLAVVGACQDDDLGVDAGAAHIFRYDGSSWAHEQKLVASDGHGGHLFGWAVAVSGSTIAVSGTGVNGAVTGAVYLYEHDGTAWLERDKIEPPAGAANAFGNSLAMSGDLLAVGNMTSSTSAGVVFLFRDQGDTWLLEQTLSAADGSEGDLFGWSVALAADLIAVGAKNDDDLGANSGSAYVFRFDEAGGGWVQEAKLLASDGNQTDYLGNTIGAAANLVIVGAEKKEGDDAFATKAGAAYAFRFNGTAWIEDSKLTRPNPYPDDHYGSALAVSGDHILIGARGTSLFRGSASILVDRFEPSDCNANGVSDILDLASGASADCNANGVPDECDLGQGDSSDVDADGVPDECQADCNGDGMPDAYQIEQGSVPDCNANGLPDECDVAGGASSDANGNAIPDECEVDCNANGVTDQLDIAQGESTDCNGNGVPDECEGSVVYEMSSGPLSPIGAGSAQSYAIAGAAEATSAVVLSFEAHADLSSSAHEWIEVEINGLPVGQIYQTDAADCADPSSTAGITVAPETFNLAILGTTDAVITMTPSVLVDADWCPDGSFIAVSVSYTGIGINDEDGDGIPDECACAADTDGDGWVDISDLTAVIMDWGTSGTSHQGDVDGSGVVDVEDLAALLGAWGPC